MMKQKSIKNIRQEFKDNGIFYTPPELAKKLKTYVNTEPDCVYDPTCGAGNLLRAFPDRVRKYGQELDGEQLALIDIPNFTGYAGDTLRDDGFAGMKFDCIVANPPFSVRWNPEELKDDERFKEFPVLPPPSKADWAFMIHILHHLSEDGIAVILCFPGILYRGQREGMVRRQFVEQNYIDRVVNIPGNTFEDTSIATAIVVLKRGRKTTDITFEDGERQAVVSRQDIEANDYNLAVNLYLPEETHREEINIDDVNRKVVTALLRQVEETVKSLVELEKVFGEEFYLKDLLDGLREIIGKYGKEG
jgi:type I restriction enzyme M protein